MSRPWGRPRCETHGMDAPCAWPGCGVGVEGEQLVVAGPRSVRYFGRHRTLEIQGGRLVATWAWVEAKVVNLVAVGRSA